MLHFHYAKMAKYIFVMVKVTTIFMKNLMSLTKNDYCNTFL